MDTDALNKWLTFAANVGVFAGLVLVAFEISQSRTSLELAASSDGVDNFTQAMEVLVQNEELSRLVYRAEHSFEQLDDFDRWRVSKYLDGFTSMSQQDYIVYLTMNDEKEGLAFRDDWRENMKREMYKEYWSHSEDRFRPEFRRLINGILADQE